MSSEDPKPPEVGGEIREAALAETEESIQTAASTSVIEQVVQGLVRPVFEQTRHTADLQEALQEPREREPTMSQMRTEDPDARMDEVLQRFQVEREPGEMYQVWDVDGVEVLYLPATGDGHSYGWAMIDGTPSGVIADMKPEQIAVVARTEAKRSR